MKKNFFSIFHFSVIKIFPEMLNLVWNPYCQSTKKQFLAYAFEFFLQATQSEIGASEAGNDVKSQK